MQTITTVEDAVGVYMEAFHTKFESQLGARRRERNLRRFMKYLGSREHSLRLDDLTTNDGQDFLDKLVNVRDGSPPSPEKNMQYRSALWSFSRFLQKTGLKGKDLFLPLKVD